MKLNFELLHSIKVSNVLGESVIWDERDNSIWWTDIMSKKIFHYFYESHVLQVHEVQERACGIALTKDISQLIVAYETGIALFNWEQQPREQCNKIEWIYRPFELGSGIRFNDARVDNQGRFWVSTMIEDDTLDSSTAMLISIDQNQKIRQHLSNFKIGNCLAWSANSKVMYFADSSSQKVIQYDFIASEGLMENPKTFTESLPNEFPDGGEVDADNNLWFANWGGSSISLCNLKGKIIDKLLLPVSQPTCLTFGGAEKNLVIITSATYNKMVTELTQEPNAGDLLIYKTNFTGNPTNKWGVSANV